MTRIATIALAASFALFGCKGKDDQPDKSAGTPDKSAGTPDKSAGTPDKTAGNPDKAAAKPDAAAAAPDKLPMPAGPATIPATVKTEEVTYKAGDTNLKGFLAYDEAVKGPRPGVLVVHEWWGHNDYARTKAKQLAAMGYTALAVDMYGDGKTADHPKDAMKFSGAIFEDLDTGVARFEAAKKVLESHESTDPKQTAAIGYCFGGAVVLHMARIGSDLDAVASFHGGLDGKAKAKKGKVKARLLVANGAADPFVKAESIEAFKKEMKEAKVSLEFMNIEGAKHSFTNPGATANGTKFELPLAYDAEADKKSWAALEAMLKDVFAKK